MILLPLSKRERERRAQKDIDRYMREIQGAGDVDLLEEASAKLCDALVVWREHIRRLYDQDHAYHLPVDPPVHVFGGGSMTEPPV